MARKIIYAFVILMYVACPQAWMSCGGGGGSTYKETPAAIEPYDPNNPQHANDSTLNPTWPIGATEATIGFAAGTGGNLWFVWEPKPGKTLFIKVYDRNGNVIGDYAAESTEPEWSLRLNYEWPCAIKFSGWKLKEMRDHE